LLRLPPMHPESLASQVNQALFVNPGNTLSRAPANCSDYDWKWSAKGNPDWNDWIDFP
jgi:hypothetical protein